ncbi:MAG: peptidylprolyl isomerase [Scytonematopsis contorta HA4267-MV1]|jgi:parvulin-like peptidyl-prolyl isomerase|nr:peptidylprolyl isomerase [Scytonematopsis contorta HA4267-MV1]
MSQPINITNEDILTQIKISCQTPEIIQEILTRKVIAHTAAEAGIKIENEELQRAADKFRLMNNLESVDATWSWLKKHQMSLTDFEEVVYSSALSTKIAAHLFLDKIEPYFFEHQLDYTGAIIYEIVVDDEELAIELFYSIQEKEISFYEVAHKYIEDKELRRKCGYRGVIRRKELKPEISAAVFAAKAPQLLKPIVTSKGIHIILVEEIIQPKLNNAMRHQICSELFDEWLKQQIEQIEIITNN